MLTFQKYVHFMRTQFPPGSRVLLLSNDQVRQNSYPIGYGEIKGYGVPKLN